MAFGRFSNQVEQRERRRPGNLKRPKILAARVTDAEYRRVRAAARGASPSDWVREAIAMRLDRTPIEIKLMAEVLSLRRFVLNVVDRLVRQEPFDAKTSKQLIDHADHDKVALAIAALKETS